MARSERALDGCRLHFFGDEGSSKRADEGSSKRAGMSEL